MKRLLCIVSVMNAGGAETFLMKVFRHLDRNRYMMDFAVSVPDKGIYDDEIISMGGHIYHITPKSKTPIKNFIDIVKIVKTNHYNYVLRTSQHSLSALELIAAWMGGAKYRVFRSSNSGTVSGSWSSILLHRMFTFLPKYIANIRIAPSTEAAEYMFGQGCIKNGKAFIIHNALDIDMYRFSERNRIIYRKEFGINDDEILVGHVGRFNQQKNHTFLIDIFAQIVKKREQSRLLLVGIGELQDTIRAKCQDQGILDKVIFAGVRSDVNRLLSALDVFLFPSLYEGMPNTVIEAQTNGIKCIVSDTITREADITNNVLFLSLSESTETWAYKTLDSLELIVQREKVADIMEREGYNIDSTVDIFTNIIFKE